MNRIVQNWLMRSVRGKNSVHSVNSVFVQAISLEGNSQVWFPNPMVTGRLAKTNRPWVRYYTNRR